MAKRSPRQISTSIYKLRWVYWQTLRRSEAYKKATKALIGQWRRACSGRAERALYRAYAKRTAHKKFCRLRGRFEAARRAVAAYKSLGEAYKHPGKGSRDPSVFNVEVELLSILDEAMRHRYYPVFKPASFVEALSKGGREDGLPELGPFSRRWGVRFPIPPALNGPAEGWVPNFPIEEIMVSPLCRPVIISGQQHRRLTLILYPAAGREILLAFVDGALDHFSPKRRRGNMAGRTLSRKRGVRNEVWVVRLSGRRLKVIIGLPAHKQQVRQALRAHLGRATASLRQWVDYAQVFKTIDLRYRDLSRPEIQKILGTSDELQVRDRERTFSALCLLFGLHR